MRAHHRLQRLFVASRLAESGTITLDGAQAHYLAHVLRMKPGDELLLFNGIDGEWLTNLAATAKRTVTISVQSPTRAQAAAPDLLFAFAPVKAARLDWMAQRATEMGAGIIQPVMTQHTQGPAPSVERLMANAVEAAEQCGRLSVPAVLPAVKFDAFLAGFEPGRRMIFCDEATGQRDPVTVLSAMDDAPLAVLIGPEGGFSEPERRRLNALPFVTPLSLGPRILRADTAAVAAMALVQACRGDRQRSPG